MSLGGGQLWSRRVVSVWSLLHYGGRPWGSACNCPGQREEMDIPPALVVPAQGAQDRCFPTSAPPLPTAPWTQHPRPPARRSEGACPLQGTHLGFLHRNWTPTSCREETPRGSCADMGSKMTCLASGRVKSKVVNSICLKKKSQKKPKQAAGSTATATSVISRKPTWINQD